MIDVQEYVLRTHFLQIKMPLVDNTHTFNTK